MRLNFSAFFSKLLIVLAVAVQSCLGYAAENVCANDDDLCQFSCHEKSRPAQAALLPTTWGELGYLAARCVTACASGMVGLWIHDTMAQHINQQWQGSKDPWIFRMIAAQAGSHVGFQLWPVVWGDYDPLSVLKGATRLKTFVRLRVFLGGAGLVYRAMWDHIRAQGRDAPFPLRRSRVRVGVPPSMIRPDGGAPIDSSSDSDEDHVEVFAMSIFSLVREVTPSSPEKIATAALYFAGESALFTLSLFHGMSKVIEIGRWAASFARS